MEIVQTKLPYSDVLAILKKGDKDFNPSLTSSLNVEKYAMKLSEYADFILLQEGKELFGCIAFYKNQEEKFIYISHYWVSGMMQGKGYGKLLLNKLCEIAIVNYREIRLEVFKNNPAYLFYQKQGFAKGEDRGSKDLLYLLMK